MNNIIIFVSYLFLTSSSYTSENNARFQTYIDCYNKIMQNSKVPRKIFFTNLESKQFIIQATQDNNKNRGYKIYSKYGVYVIYLNDFKYNRDTDRQEKYYKVDFDCNQHLYAKISRNPEINFVLSSHQFNIDDENQAQKENINTAYVYAQYIYSPIHEAEIETIKITRQERDYIEVQLWQEMLTFLYTGYINNTGIETVEEYCSDVGLIFQKMI